MNMSATNKNNMIEDQPGQDQSVITPPAAVQDSALVNALADAPGTDASMDDFKTVGEYRCQNPYLVAENVNVHYGTNHARSPRGVCKADPSVQSHPDLG